MQISFRIREHFCSNDLALASWVCFFSLAELVFPVPDKVEYSTIITDNKGEVLNAYLTKDQKWRMKTELDEISRCCKKRS
ncbi:MAG: hypothetical protein IPJ29_15305 [Chitinophagaceae bacterium]|nr:hypothetical protein [Chitinophagaceae bacterium]